MYNMFASTNNLNYVIDGGSKQRNGWNFQNFLIDGSGDSIQRGEGWWNFCNLLIDVGEIASIPNPGVGVSF